MGNLILFKTKMSTNEEIAIILQNIIVRYVSQMNTEIKRHWKERTLCMILIIYCWVLIFFAEEKKFSTFLLHYINHVFEQLNTSLITLSHWDVVLTTFPRRPRTWQGRQERHDIVLRTPYVVTGTPRTPEVVDSPLRLF